MSPTRSHRLLLLFLPLIPVSLLVAEPTPAAAHPAASEEEDDEGPDESAVESRPDPSIEKFWQSLSLLESGVSAEQAAGRKLMEESSDLEYSHAQVQLGNCLLTGSYGFTKNPRKAVNLFRLAAERGNAFAQVSLGTCYATGTGIRRDDAKAKEWLTAALKDGADFSRPTPPADFLARIGESSSPVAGSLASDPVAGSQATAHFLLAQILSREKQPAQAQEHYVAAAVAGPDGRSGVYQAAVEAALNFAFGRGIPQDAARARQMLEQSRRLNARMGVNLIHNYVQLKIVDDFAVADLEESVTAAGAAQESLLQLQIARTLGNRKSKEYNAAEAAQWYQLAAENGQVWAMLSLALLHAEGDLGKPDPAQAFHWFERAGDGDKPKHYLGTANLAIGLQQGLGTARDEKRAAELFKKHQNGDMVCYLGTIGKAPTKFVTYEDVLALNQEWARKKNDPHAQYLLALRYLSGSGVKADFDDALRWLKKSAKTGHGGALCHLGYLYETRPFQTDFRSMVEGWEAAAEAYRAAGAANHVEGLANYANCLYRGTGVKQNENLAIANYERCLELDPKHSRSHANLGLIYNNKLLRAGGSFNTGDWKEKMLAHYEASANSAEGHSVIALGDLYYEGRLVTKNLAKAYTYYEQATDIPMHKAAAHYRLGFMHEHGQGVPVTYTEAAYHYRIAALEGHMLSLRRLINFYLTGTGVSQDFDRAVHWLTLLARSNQLDALPSIADVLIKKGEYAQAVKLLKSMTEMPYGGIAGHAHERLSQCYRAGAGVKKNLKRAERHFKIAVEKENGDALTMLAHRQMEDGQVEDGLANLRLAARTSGKASYNLGQIYFFGGPVQAEQVRAMRYFHQAVRQNYGDAHYFLAGLCWNHDPLAPPLEEAIDLAGRAEKLGHPKATELRERLEQRLRNQQTPAGENTHARSS